MDSCGCAQYAQPLPAGAEYCNYKKNRNWSEYSSTSLCLNRPLPATSLVSTTLPAPSTFPATQCAEKRRICLRPLQTPHRGA